MWAELSGHYRAHSPLQKVCQPCSGWCPLGGLEAPQIAPSWGAHSFSKVPLCPKVPEVLQAGQWDARPLCASPTPTLCDLCPKGMGDRQGCGAGEWDETWVSPTRAQLCRPSLCSMTLSQSRFPRETEPTGCVERDLLNWLIGWEVPRSVHDWAGSSPGRSQRSLPSPKAGLVPSYSWRLCLFVLFRPSTDWTAPRPLH